jgi:hypothetical protein
VKKEVKELIEWALKKGESKTKIISLVESAYGKREAKKAATFLETDYNSKKSLNKVSEKEGNNSKDAKSKKFCLLNAKKISFTIIAIVIALILFWLAKPLPVKGEFTFAEEWNYPGKKGIELTILLETKNHIIKPTKWNLRSTFWLLRREYKKYDVVRIVACTGFFTSAYAKAEYIDGKETRFEILR